MKYSKILIPFALFLAVASSAQAKNEPPEVTMDGLHRIHDTEMDLIYALPGTDLSQYTRIYLIDAQVNFVKDYRNKQNQIAFGSVNGADMERMKEALAAIFREEFTNELQNNAGYVIVDGVAEDVLAVRPAILDLDVLNPESSPNTRSAIASVGQMTLYMELIDSVSGDTLVKGMDHWYDRTRAQIHVRDKDRNEKAAREIVSHWAQILRKGLDEAHVRAGATAEEEQ